MRFFLALEVPEHNRHEITQVQHAINKILPNLRLTNPEKLHLTLAFLDEQPDELQDPLVSMLEQTVKDITNFEVTPSYIDGFPNLHHAHILWMGVKGDVDKLFLIRERIKDGLKQLDIHIDERRYTPHIAIGKLSELSLASEQEAQIQKLAADRLSPINVTSIKLYQSIPNHGLHSHNTLAEVKLT